MARPATDKEQAETPIIVTLSKQPRTVRVAGVGPIEISKQLDRRGRLQIILKGLPAEGFGLTAPARTD